MLLIGHKVTYDVTNLQAVRLLLFSAIGFNFVVFVDVCVDYNAFCIRKTQTTLLISYPYIYPQS